MSRFYVTGGRQRSGAKGHIEWFSYGEASIYAFDIDTREVRECVSHETPAELRPEDPQSNIVFKAGSMVGDELLVCTQTEILSYRVPEFTLERSTSHPWLNDVHHVVRNAGGNLLVANTGLDLVLELTDEGELVREWSVLADESPWDRFDRGTDYRRVVTTKPHHSHPNYVFEVDEELWVTRFEQKDAVSLVDPERRIDIGQERVHDGVVSGSRVYFTSVDGHVAVADPATCRVEGLYDLNAMTDTEKTLGWCRGIHVLDPERVLVGFSRLRPSKFRDNVRWAKYKLGMREDAGRLETRVACYDLARGCCDWEIDLEAHGLNAVFSILEADRVVKP